MMRCLAWLTGSLLLLATGCPGPIQVDDIGGGTRDMTGGGVDDGGTLQDLGPDEPNRCNGAGCVGSPCVAADECKEGKDGTPKVCWKETMLNNPRYVPTPGGYCTQECTSNADCGTGYCFQPEGEPKKYCMALCRSAGRCRHPGYACTFETGAGTDGICYPDKNLDCQPTKGGCDAIVEAGAQPSAKGGCIRAAFEDRGICRVACQVGTKTCPKDFRFGALNARDQHCIFLDTTTDSAGRPSATGDKWKGAVCIEYATPQIQPGQRCSFWDECTDGFQCDRYGVGADKQVCRQLCMQGSGAQDDTLFKPTGAMPWMAGSMCTNAAEGCSNALQAGASQPGLCTPR